jgi:hypothetical protein
LSVCPARGVAALRRVVVAHVLEPVGRADEVERLLAPRLGGEHARQVL